MGEDAVTENARRSFLDGIPEIRKEELLKQLKAVWTHDSTAIEGNTLTLGDTMAVLEYGLTVKGKPLKDHFDVVTHARGVDFIQTLIGKRCIEEEDLFSLHRTVISDPSNDIYRPVGAWKREDNGTYGAEGGKSVYMPYAPADDTPALMKDWLRLFNGLFSGVRDESSAIDAYIASHVSFVRIHPFFDGNGRIARLVSNLPLLRSGFPPIVVPAEARLEYIAELWRYQRLAGRLSGENPVLLPHKEELSRLKELAKDWWRVTIDLVEEAKKL